MRWMGMIAALFTLIAAFFGVSSLTAFGFDAWDIVVILVPMAVGVALFFTGMTYFGVWTSRLLNRRAETGHEDPTHMKGPGK